MLSDTERTQFAAELVDAARAGMSLRQHNLFMGTINGWRSTAEAYAAGIGRQPIEWLEAAGVAQNPRAT